MSDKRIKAIIANTLLEVADALETEQYGKKPVTGFASKSSEHGQNNIEEAMKIAEMKGLKAVLIEGEDLHKKMGEMLGSGEIDDAVTMHYPFPIGVSTVGKIITPDKGKPAYIATTIDTSDTNHISSMVKNAIYEIIAAKADGVKNPTVGITNIDSARQTEEALLKLAENGYDINLAEPVGTDGGIIMRGNGLLGGTPDIMVMDSLTGNLMIKMSSSYITGGNYESLGFGCGPGMDGGYDRLIMVMSRAPDTPAIAGVVGFTISLVRHGWRKVAGEEFEKANEAGLKDVANELESAGRKDAGATSEEMKMPPKEVVTSQIPGIGVIDLEDVVKALWKAGIYAESSMGCTGPIVLMSDANKNKVHEILKAAGRIS